MTDTTLDRATGALLGVHAGDSLGATTEFSSPNNDPSTWVTDIVGGGPFNWSPGDPTDDTDLTVAVVRAYLDLFATDGDGSDRLDGLGRACARHFVDWYKAGPKDIGGTTSQAMGRLARGVAHTESGVDRPDAQANGSLMRCIATGVVRTDAAVRREETAMISAITHASPVAVASCVAYNDIVAALIGGADVDGAIEAAATVVGPDSEVGRVLLSRLDAPLTASMPWQRGGWVLTALDIAVWAARQTDRTYSDLLVEVINKGGDADTNGAIAGGLVGARDGRSGIPDRWVGKLALGDELVAAAKVFTDTATEGAGG